MKTPTSITRANNKTQSESPSKSETVLQKSHEKDSHSKDDSRRIAGEKSSQGGSGHPHKASPVAVERFIKGIHFPANKKDLVNKAKENKAPLDVLHVLDLFDEKKEFHTPIDVAKEVGRVE